MTKKALLGSRRALLLPSIALVAIGATLAIAGCGGGPDTEGTGTASTNSASQASALENSSAQEAVEKTGESSMGAMKPRSDTTRLAFSSQPSSLPVGKAATWTLKVTDAKSGAAVKDFAVVHDKLMHLIVVSKDLSWFNHVHPTHQGKGVFTVTTTLPRAGGYKLYADYTPKDGGNEVAQHEFATAGSQATATPVALVPDKMQGAWMKKKVTAHAEGDPGSKGGAAYEVALMPMPMPITAGQEAMLHFQVRDAKGQPVKDLQPYLGALGHCVILSRDTTQYLHSHPMEGGMDDMGGMDHGADGGAMKHDMSKMGETKTGSSTKGGGPDVMFHTTFPSAGLYKTWGQFMHKGKVITAAFVVNVAAAKAGTAQNAVGEDAAAHDESKPHAH